MDSTCRIEPGRRTNSIFATLLRAVLQRGALALIASELAGLANKLVDSRHKRPSKNWPTASGGGLRFLLNFPERRTFCDPKIAASLIPLWKARDFRS